MADPQLDRLLSSLEVTFEAAVNREEEEAATDLAFSLGQDQPLQEVLLRGGPLRLLLEDGAAIPVSIVGADYVIAGDPPRLVAQASATFVTGGDSRLPREAATSLLTVLRTWARSGASVAVEADGRSYNGVLVQATSDHLVLDAPAGRFVVGRGGVRQVRLISGDSAGEL